jgi:uncharacterized spore protein YtfJ
VGVGAGVNVGHKVGLAVGVGFGVGQGVGVVEGQGNGVGVGGGVHAGFTVGAGSFVGVGFGKIVVVNVSTLGVAETKLSSTHIADAIKMIRMGTQRRKIVILPFRLYVGTNSSPFKQKNAEHTIKL